MNLDYQVPLPYYHTNQYRVMWAEKLNSLIYKFYYANKSKSLIFLHLPIEEYAKAPYNLNLAFQDFVLAPVDDDSKPKFLEFRVILKI